MANRNIFNQPIHLGIGASAIEQPPFAGTECYKDYADRHNADGAEGRLVSAHEFTENWAHWEMHPNGEEVLVCLSGQINLHQQLTDETTQSVILKQGDYAINPRGIWHSADVSGEATVLFITAGLDTQHKPR